MSPDALGQWTQTFTTCHQPHNTISNQNSLTKLMLVHANELAATASHWLSLWIIVHWRPWLVNIFLHTCSPSLRNIIVNQRSLTIIAVNIKRGCYMCDQPHNTISNQNSLTKLMLVHASRKSQTEVIDVQHCSTQQWMIADILIPSWRQPCHH